jgi:hypothetical protein
MGPLLKLCYKRHIRVLHLTVHELPSGAEIEINRGGSNLQSPAVQASAIPLRHFFLYFTTYNILFR